MSVIRDLRRNVELLRFGAAALRARYVLACIANAPGGALFNERFEAFAGYRQGIFSMLLEVGLAGSDGEEAAVAFRPLPARRRRGAPARGRLP